jgi:hypothetical protein
MKAYLFKEIYKEKTSEDIAYTLKKVAITEAACKGDQTQNVTKKFSKMASN